MTRTGPVAAAWCRPPAPDALPLLELAEEGRQRGGMRAGRDAERLGRAAPREILVAADRLVVAQQDREALGGGTVSHAPQGGPYIASQNR